MKLLKVKDYYSNDNTRTVVVDIEVETGFLLWKDWKTKKLVITNPNSSYSRKMQWSDSTGALTQGEQEQVIALIASYNAKRG